MGMHTILATGCDAVFYHFLLETLASWKRLGLLDRADVGIIDMGLDLEQVSALKAQGHSVVVPGWTIDVPQELRTGFMIGDVARTALREYFPGYDVYIWFDADAWAQTDEFFDAFVQGALAKGVAVVREDGHGYKRDYVYRRWWYGHMMASFGLWRGFRMAYKPAINSGIWAMSASAPHWEPWREVYAGLIDGRRRLNLDQHALNAAIDLFDLPEAQLPARCNWIATLSHPVWDARRRQFCTPGPDPQPISVMHLAGPDKRRTYQLRQLGGGIKPTPITYTAYVDPTADLAMAG